MTDILKPWKISTISFEVFCPAPHIWNLFSVFDLTTDTGRKMLVSHPNTWKCGTEQQSMGIVFTWWDFMHLPAFYQDHFLTTLRSFLIYEGNVSITILHSVNVVFSTFSDKIYGRTRIGWEIRYLAFRKFKRRSHAVGKGNKLRIASFLIENLRHSSLEFSINRRWRSTEKTLTEITSETN